MIGILLFLSFFVFFYIPYKMKLILYVVVVSGVYAMEASVGST